MTLKTDMAADLSTVFFNTDEFAEAATLTPKGGSAKTINIVCEEESLSSQSIFPPGDVMTILVQYTDHNTPLLGDTYTINSVTWYHNQVLSGGRGEGVWHIEVSRSKRKQVM